MSSSSPSEVVILGGGIVGCATAHYLRKLGGEGLKITVIDKVGIAAAASGRAGGFLARDWHNGAGARLAACSFALHAELAAEFGAAEIGYRPCRAVQPTCRGGKTEKCGSSWFDGCVGQAPEIAPRDTAAQVIPAKLTQALFDSSGARLLVGTPTALRAAEPAGSRVLTVATGGGATNEDVKCDALVLACGPWTSQVAKELGISMSAQVFGLKAYSVLFEPKSPVDDSCLFMNWQGDPFAGEFELYSRLDGVYVCGCGESPCVVQEEPSEVACSEKAGACLKASAASVSSALEGAKVLRETACYLPVAQTGSILAGKLPQQNGIYVATGHTCWGILNGPATGKGMAELILSGGAGETAKVLSAFAPR